MAKQRENVRWKPDSKSFSIRATYMYELNCLDGQAIDYMKRAKMLFDRYNYKLQTHVNGAEYMTAVNDDYVPARILTDFLQRG